jgi:hypothetical protein
MEGSSYLDTNSSYTIQSSHINQKNGVVGPDI